MTDQRDLVDLLRNPEMIRDATDAIRELFAGPVVYDSETPDQANPPPLNLPVRQRAPSERAKGLLRFYFDFDRFAVAGASESDLHGLAWTAIRTWLNDHAGVPDQHQGYLPELTFVGFELWSEHDADDPPPAPELADERLPDRDVAAASLDQRTPADDAG